MTRLLRVAAVAVLVGGATAVLTSCAGDPEPIVTQTPTPTVAVVTPSPSPTPSVTPEQELLEQIPENARGEDFISATNFAKLFVREYERMFAEHDSALFSYLSAENCEFCASALRSFAEDEAAGSSVTGGEITPSDTLANGGLQDDGSWLVQFSMHIAEAKYFNADGSLRTTVAASDYDVGVLLDRRDEHWVVAGLNFEVAN